MKPILILRNYLPLEQGLRLPTSTTIGAILLMLRNYLPLEQGLRHLYAVKYQLCFSSQKLSSIRTRIKTVTLALLRVRRKTQKLSSIRTRIKTCQLLRLHAYDWQTQKLSSIRTRIKTFSLFTLFLFIAFNSETIFH